MGHAHDVIDRDPYFIIDADSRTISDQSETGTSLMQYDHNSERITFEIPRTIDEHDMSVCDRVEIHYINIGSGGQRTNGVYEVEDLSIDPDDDEVVLFTWLVSQNATSYSGTLSFVIRFICASEGNFDYVWNTAVYSNITVGIGISNAEAIATQYADILGAWYNQFIAAGNDGVAKIEKAAEDAVIEAKAAIDETVETEIMPTIEATIEAEKVSAIVTIKTQADEIVNLVLERLPAAEEASF